MLRIHFQQQWFNLSDPAMEEALYDIPMFCEFAGLDMGADHLTDECTILHFHHLLDKHRPNLQLLSTRQFGHVKVRYRGCPRTQRS